LNYLHDELEKKEHHTHLNSVSKFGETTYVLLNRQGVIVQVEPEVKIVLEDPLIKAAHSPVVCEDGKRLILCGSLKKYILIYHLKKGKLIKKIPLLDFNEVATLYQQFPDQPFNKSIFVRGLEIIGKNRILVGVSPAAILEIDIKKNKLLDFYQYSFDVGDAIHGLVHVKR
jgi:hypothetical protein